MRPIRHLLLLTLLLLGSCVTSKKVKDYLAKEKNRPAAEAIVTDWLEWNREWHAARAAKDFPVQDSSVMADTAATEESTATAERNSVCATHSKKRSCPRPS